MRVLEKRPSMLRVVAESIEMKRFASEEPCVLVSVRGSQEDYWAHYARRRRYLEHPLVSETEEETEEDQDPEPLVQTPPQQQVKLKRVPSVRTEDLDDLVPDPKEDMEIELEVFPPLNTPQSEHECFASLNQVTRVKWRRVDHRMTGLVVKDVVCLPRGHLLAHPDRHGAPGGKERAAMATRGMTARIAINCGWSANQMESSLCVHGSRALFVPDPPVEGWTGEQVLQICDHGPLYILSHHDYNQVESHWSESWTQAGVKRREFPLEVSMGSCDDTQQGQ